MNGKLRPLHGWSAVALTVIVIAVKAIFGGGDSATSPASSDTTATAVEAPANAKLDSSAVIAAAREHATDRWVDGAATVIKSLPDDTQGDRHQRFLCRLDDGSTILVAHNIDLAPRVPLEPSARVEFRGRFEWNDKGGVVHWTHRDPRDPARGGWIRVDGRLYR